ncbi:MAG: hypothetical protein FWD06_09710 [Oscillospiraceae bacterium]|nr:hypothetical protein [Oscillospiraceae bacterium]
MVIGLITGIFSLVSMTQLLKRKPKFLRTWNIANTLSLVGHLINVITLIATGDISNGFMRQFLTIIFGMGIAVLWNLYCVRSVRVRTYMGSDEYIKQSIFLTRVTPPQPAVPDEQPTQHF